MHSGRSHGYFRANDDSGLIAESFSNFEIFAYICAENAFILRLVGSWRRQQPRSASERQFLEA